MQTFPIINTLKKYILFVSISPDIEKELENEILEFSKQTRTQVPNTFFSFFLRYITIIFNDVKIMSKTLTRWLRY